MQRNRFMKAAATVAALAMVGVAAFAGSATAQASFTDVDGDEFYGPAVEWLEEQNLTTGFGGSDAQPSDVYEPHLTVDRAQIATFLWRMAGRPDADPNHGFTDVDDEAFYGPAVAWLRESGVTTGVGGSDIAPGTTFEPMRAVTRGEAITFLWRYGGRPGAPPPPAYPPHGFTDTTPGAFYEPALNWAKAEGITTGFGGSHANPTDIYVPDGELTRGEMGALIWRYAGFPAPTEAGCLAPGEWPCPEDDTPPTTQPPTTTTTQPPTTTTTQPPTAGLSDAWASDLSSAFEGQYQAFEVTLETNLPEDATLTIDLSEAEAGIVSYDDCADDVWVYSGTGDAALAVTADESAVVTYTAGDDDDAEHVIGVVLEECVDTEDDVATYDVTWTRQDTGATATAAFDVDELPGFVFSHASNLQSDEPGQTQSLDIVLGQGLDDAEEITIDLSEAEAGAVTYADCEDGDLVVLVGTGDASIDIDNGSVTITFLASAHHDPFDLIAIDVTGCVDTEDEEAPYEVTWSRSDSDDTISSWFEVREEAVPTGFSWAWASDLQSDETDQTQFVDAGLRQGLASGESITIDLSEAEAGEVTYFGCTDTDIEVFQGIGDVSIVVVEGVSAFITFEATADHDPFEAVALDITNCVDAAEEATYEVVWTRNDTGGTIWASFDVWDFGENGEVEAAGRSGR